MGERSWRWWSNVVFVVGLIGAPRIAAAKGAAGSCGCADVNDLINRIAVAQAAQDKFAAEIPAIQETSKTAAVNYDGVGKGSSQTNYDVLKESVKLAQAEVQDPTARSGTGKTDGYLCEPTVTAATACLTEVLRAHENYHQTTCTDERKKKHLGKNDDRFTNKPLLEYVPEEIAAYQKEIDEAVRRLRAIEGSCRPRGWVGTIRVAETRTLHVTVKTPGNNPYADGTTRTSDDEFRRWGTVVKGRTPETAYWKAQDRVTSHDTSGGRVGCRGGLKTQPADHHVTNTVHQESSLQGGSTVVPTVDLSIDGSSYTISFTIPVIHGQVWMTGYNQSSGGCDDFNTPTNGGPFPNDVDASEPIAVKGTMNPKDLDLDGSQPLDRSGGVAAPGVMSSHTLTVSWHLHKIE